MYVAALSALGDGVVAVLCLVVGLRRIALLGVLDAVYGAHYVGHEQHVPSAAEHRHQREHASR